MKVHLLFFLLLVPVCAFSQTILEFKSQPLKNYTEKDTKEKSELSRSDLERQGEVHYYAGKYGKSYKSFLKARVTEDVTDPLYDISQRALFNANRIGFKLYGGVHYVLPLKLQDYNSNYFSAGNSQDKKGLYTKTALSDARGYSYGIRAQYAMWPYQSKKQPYLYKPAVTLVVNYLKEWLSDPPLIASAALRACSC